MAPPTSQLAANFIHSIYQLIQSIDPQEENSDEFKFGARFQHLVSAAAARWRHRPPQRIFAVKQRNGDEFDLPNVGWNCFHVRLGSL